MITRIREKKETGFSLLELSVAVGVAAIVASAGIVATTAFIGSAQDKRDNYTANANTAILDAESSSLALGLTPASDVTLNVSEGETVLGGTFTVTAVGLKVGSSYSVILQSDPVVLASGIVGESGEVSETVTVPADTPAGWHSLTLLGTYADDAPVSDVSYFKIGSTGLLDGTATTTPIAPVSNAASSNVSPTGFTVTWDAPTGLTEPIAGYTILVDGEVDGTADAGDTSYVLTGLTPNTAYNVTVRATNANGSEDISLTVTTPYPDTAPVANLTSSNITPTGFTVGWDAPGVSSPITGYTVLLDGVLKASFIQSTTSYTFTGLDFATSYTVTVNATNNNGTEAQTIAFATLNPIPISATGGSISDITVDGVDYRVHQFTSVGTSSFTVSNAGNFGGGVEYLVIAGGGGGGGASSKNTAAGGGGAGGYRSSVQGEQSGGGASAESPLTITAGTYTVTVGTGGSGRSNNANGVDGSDSVFGPITSIGGGGGGGVGNGNAGDGGSGGGGSNAGTGTAGQGFNGQAAGHRYGAGAGGGAGESGGTDGSRRGGDGVSSSITGSAVTRGGGGSGGGANPGEGLPGGDGGGGTSGGNGRGGNGSANTGGGGGGAGTDADNRGPGGTGGSGVVIVRYPLEPASGGN